MLLLASLLPVALLLALLRLAMLQLVMLLSHTATGCVLRKGPQRRYG